MYDCMVAKDRRNVPVGSIALAIDADPPNHNVKCNIGCISSYLPNSLGLMQRVLFVTGALVCTTKQHFYCFSEVHKIIAMHIVTKVNL